jgi:serine/threonine protein kinase
MFEDPIILNDLLPRARFLNYQFLEKIGTGGEGVVWSGMDLEHNRIVAIKLIEITELDEQKARDLIFDKQVYKLLSLSHPHILPMYDYGITKNIRYLVSPYIPGGSLRDRLNVKEPAIHETLHFATEIAGALDYLHEQNILHRDLKPSNILLDFSDNLYLSDFGLARFIPSTTKALHTGRGTPPYAPPEQHAMKVMTRQSDIFSFGVLLFEMFTRHLPWDGNKALGIEQLYSREEIPDPCEISPQLPRELAKVLRLMTNVNPTSRPRSAGEAVHELCSAFGFDPLQIGSDRPTEESLNRGMNAQELLKHSLIRWEPHGDTVALKLTQFALIELEHKQTKEPTSPVDTQRFLLHSALVFGLDDDHWWTSIEDISLKMEVASSLISKDDEAITGRVVDHLLNDQTLTHSKEIASGRISEALIGTAKNVHNPKLLHQILQVLLKLSVKHSEWQQKVFSDELDNELAYMALNDPLLGDEAAHLIGQIRSIKAVNFISQNAPENTRISILMEIQKAAGSLPSPLSAITRLTVSAELMLGHLIERPVSLLAVFVAAYFGSAFSIGLQNYLIIRIPNFMDAVRISVSVERGLFLGTFFAVGILLIRLIVERFPDSKALPRLALSTLIGGSIFAIGFIAYDSLMVKIDLHGLLFLAGCMLCAFGFAQGNLTRPGSLRITVAAGAVFSALALTWIIYLNLLNNGLNLSPLFFYENTWSAWKIIGTMTLFSLPISFFGTLLDLSPED